MFSNGLVFRVYMYVGLRINSKIHTCTIGSDFARRLRPSTNFGKSAGFFGSTATLTTGLTLNFMTLIRKRPDLLDWFTCLLDSHYRHYRHTFKLCAFSNVVIVPVLTRNWSTPTKPQMLPHGTFSIGSVYLPIMSIVRWIFLMHKSSFLPGT